MPQRIRFSHLLALALGLGLAGCAMTGNHQSAKMPGKGESEVALAFGLNGYAQKDTGQFKTQAAKDSATLWFPVVLPEIGFATALSDRWAVGGRIAPQALGIEGYVKWGFYQGDHLFLAVAPGLGARIVGVLGGGSSQLPLYATYEFNPAFSLDGSLFVSHIELGSNNPDVQKAFKSVAGGYNGGGLGLGAQFSGEVFFARPWIEFSGYSPVDRKDNTVVPFGVTSIALEIGWTLGKEKKQLDRMEKKLDELKRK